MPIVVARIDDRLVHGQVVIGWCRPLKIDRIVLVDDEVAASEFERDLYRLAVPEGIDLEVIPAALAPDRLTTLAEDDARTLILTATVTAMVALQHSRPALIQAINLGGIHDGPGRRERLRYVYLSAEEERALQEVAESGVSVTAQDLPTTRPVDLADLA